MKLRSISLLLVIVLFLTLAPSVRAADGSLTASISPVPEAVLSEELPVRAPAEPVTAPTVSVNPATRNQYIHRGDTMVLRGLLTVHETVQGYWCAAIYNSDRQTVADIEQKNIPAPGSYNLTLTWNTAGLPAGTYTLALYTVDTRGNVLGTAVYANLYLTDASTPLTEVRWSKATLYLKKGNSDSSCSLVCTPADTTEDRTPSFRSDAEAVASVYSLGGVPSIRGVNYGYATIVGSAAGKSDYLTVEVCTDDQGHSMKSKVTKEPTCTDYGWATPTCEKCGFYHPNSGSQVPMLRHDYGEIEEIIQEPICTATGLGIQTCKTCGYRDSAAVIPALCHQWDEGEIITEEDGLSWGEKLYTCLRCGETEQRGYHTCPSISFVDRVKDLNWAHKGIDFCVEQGLMVGTGEDRFSPDRNLTRAELVCILWRLSGSPEAETEAPFTDLKKDWYIPAARWAAETGLILGTTETTFAPDLEVTREMFATILYRYAGLETELSQEDRADLSPYGDQNRIHSYAEEALSWAVAKELIVGTSSTALQPRGQATRAQAAVILMRFVNML